jgi:acyl-CoA thioesterase-2
MRGCTAVAGLRFDFHLLGTAGLPHAAATGATLVRASIDHAMWFHQPFRIDEWLLTRPTVRGRRGARVRAGNLFDGQGRLVASTAQEGLMRTREPHAVGCLHWN